MGQRYKWVKHNETRTMLTSWIWRRARDRRASIWSSARPCTAGSSKPSVQTTADRWSRWIYGRYYRWRFEIASPSSAESAPSGQGSTELDWKTSFTRVLISDILISTQHTPRHAPNHTIFCSFYWPMSDECWTWHRKWGNKKVWFVNNHEYKMNLFINKSNSSVTISS